MSDKHQKLSSRRAFLAGSAALIASPALAQTSSNVNSEATTQTERDLTETVRRNISSFRTLDWRPYFDNTRNGAVLVDIDSRAVHFWSEDQSVYKLYPSSVVGPSWRPTPSMLQRNPEWPEFIGPGPDNPLGTHALYLSWTYYRIHGTHDTRKIGRRSSNGCIGLYNEHIAELFSMTKVGTQVLLI